ncbi:MAG: GNAT family N-acetyltransferase [Chloroflexota bacterium]
MESVEYRKDGYVISTDPARLDLDVVHGYLAQSYWAENIPRAIVEKSVEHSLCFGVYEEASGVQVGLARVVSDYATFAYLADVFILEDYRGRGLSKWLMECILSHPELQLPRSFLLATRDAHGLYSRFGFAPLDAPEKYMLRRNERVYRNRAYVVMTTIENGGDMLDEGIEYDGQGDLQTS